MFFQFHAFVNAHTPIKLTIILYYTEEHLVPTIINRVRPLAFQKPRCAIFEPYAIFDPYLLYILAFDFEFQHFDLEYVFSEKKLSTTKFHDKKVNPEFVKLLATILARPF